MQQHTHTHPTDIRKKLFNRVIVEWYLTETEGKDSKVDSGIYQRIKKKTSVLSKGKCCFHFYKINNNKA